MLQIRKAYPTDAYTLVQIRDMAWKSDYYDILSNEINVEKNKTFQDSVKHLQDQITENNRILVAVEENSIVGFVFYAKAQGNNYENGEIREIYVLPAYQKRGIGKKLFDEAMLALKKMGFSSFIVSCPVHNKDMGFFFHLGGMKRGIHTEKILGHSFECEIIYYDIDSNVVEKSTSNEWNQLYMKAQNYLFLLNHVNKELAVILTDTSHFYVGLGIKDKVCPIDSALSNMYLGGDKKISKILILNQNSIPVVPCGKCRDLLMELGEGDASILFDIGDFKTVFVKDLNPFYKKKERS